MRSIINLLKDILELLKVFKQFKDSVEVGDNFIKILTIGICWGAGTSRSVTFPITYSSNPKVFLTVNAALTASATYVVAGYVKNVTKTGMSYGANYLGGNGGTFAGSGVAGESFTWLAIGILGGVLTNFISHLRRRWAVC